jgi:hypothetical protein
MIEAEDVIKALLSELEIYTGPTMRCFPGVKMANEWLNLNSKTTNPQEYKEKEG